MYRVGKHAYAHGVYIRPGEYVDMWRTVARLAKEADVSISEFVSHNMYIIVEGGISPNSRLGTTRVSRVVHKKRRR